MRRRRIVIAGLLLLVLAVAAIAACQWVVMGTGRGRLYDTIAEVPVRDVGLLLGTTEKHPDGSHNLYFDYRITAAAELYKAGKIRHVLVSGDNRRADYDEPACMHRALLKAGVPESAMTLDCAGFRTLDSVVRAKKVFGQDKFTLISQRFHDQRALLIADHYGIDAIGYCAADVGLQQGLRIQIREALARVKAVMDLYLLHTPPKFLGPHIAIPLP